MRPVPDRSARLGGVEWQRAFERRLAFLARVARLAHLRSVAPEAPAFVDGNDAAYLADGRDQMAWMLAAIENARTRIDLEIYIFEADATGETLRDALARAAARGVKVRLMYDSVGSGDAGPDFFAPIEAAGGKVTEFNPVAPWRLRMSRLGRRQNWLPNRRDHRKLLLCDAPASWVGRLSNVPPEDVPESQREAGDDERVAIALTGGRNIADEYLGKTRDEGQWRDCGVVILGPVVAPLSRLFDAMWSHADGPDLEVPAFHCPPAGAFVIMPIGSQPGFLNLLQWALSRMAVAVREELRISCAYFIPSARWRKALAAVARRTDRCLLLVPKASDVPAVDAASRHLMGDLLRAGVQIRRYARGLLHEKTLVYDRVLTVIGSSNLDPRSFRLNYELSVLVVGEPFAAPVIESHERGLSEGEPYTLDIWRARTVWQRMGDWFWSLWRSQL